MKTSAKKMLHILSWKETGIYTVNCKTSAIEKQVSPEKEKKEKTTDHSVVIPSRYVLALLGFLSFAILNAQRVNMVIAMVAMTNSSTQETTVSNDEECVSASGYNASHHLLKRGPFNWNTEIQNYIIGSSFVGFVLTQILGGRLSETVGAKQVLIFSILCTSICNLISPFAANWSVYCLIIAQFIKGMAQGFIQPVVSCLMVRWFAKPERSFLSSVTFSGFPAGALFGGITSGALCETNFLGGWPSVFYVFGLCGVILAIFLQIFAYNFPEEDRRIKDSELKYITDNLEASKTLKDSKIPWTKMIFSIPTWALFAGMFGQYWMTFYFISVHPTFLSSVLKFNVSQSGLLASLPYILQVLVTWLASFVCDLLVEKKWATTTAVRKTTNTLSCAGFSLSLIGAAFAGCNITLNTLCFFTALGSIGLGFPGSLTAPMDMTVEFAGTLVGLSCTVASTSGFIIPVVIGQLMKEKQNLLQWHKMFFISTVTVMISALLFHIFGSTELQKWEKSSEDTPVKEKSKG